MLIYLARNTVNGKCYVGQTARTLSRRMIEHKCHSGRGEQLLYRAIRKYGWEAFSWEVLEYCDEADIDMSERFWINCYGSMTPKGYNLKGGGHNNHSYSDEARAKISRSKKESLKSQEHMKRLHQKLRGSKRPDTAEKFSKVVSAYDASGEWIGVYPSARQAGCELGVHFSTIHDCLKGRIKSCRNKERQVIQFRFGDNKDSIEAVSYKTRGTNVTIQPHIG